MFNISTEVLNIHNCNNLDSHWIDNINIGGHRSKALQERLCNFLKLLQLKG